MRVMATLVAGCWPNSSRGVEVKVSQGDLETRGAEALTSQD